MTSTYETTDSAISLIEDMFDKCIDTIAKNVKNSEEQNEYIKILEKTVHQCANLDVKHKHLEKIIQESKDECFENGEMNINQVFQKNSNSTNNKYENETKVENHRFVKKFQSKTLKLFKGEEKEVASVVTNNTPSMPLDPITQVPIVSPVKNKHCGHLYEKSSIQKMLAKKKKIRCPFFGCASQNYFVYSDLDENVVLSQQTLNNSDINVSINETL